MIARGLKAEGVEVALQPAGEVSDLSGFDAVVVGGALYAGRWQSDARRLVKRQAAGLRQLPVWFFSSGPLDDSAERQEIPPTAQVRALMGRVGARGHATFGGRLTHDAKGFPASAMAKKHTGDWRSHEHAEAWAKEIARSLSVSPKQQAALVRPEPFRGLLGGLCLFAGLTAIAGGLQLISDPTGSRIGLAVSLLSRTPFHDFLAPGLVLALVVGLTNTVAGIFVLQRRASANRAAFASGGILTGWIVAETLLLREFHWLAAAYFVLGLGISLLALRRESPALRVASANA